MGAGPVESGPGQGGDDPLPDQHDPERANPEDGAAPTPGQLMGLAGLLRAWRAVASERLGRQITQQDVAGACERSVRWYRDLEAGANTRLTREQCEAIGQLFLLGRDELQALLLYSMGGAVTAGPAPDFDTPTRRAVQALLDQQTNPAWLLDSKWNIIGYNDPMKTWCPWVMEPGANLLLWGLLSDEAKTVFVDWNKHAIEWLAMLRFSALRHPQDAEIGALVTKIINGDAHLRRLWKERCDVTEGREPYYYRVSLPTHRFEIVELESQTLFPAALPDCRMVIMTPLNDDATSDAPGQDPRSGEQSGRSSNGLLPGQISVATPTEAATYAGEGAVELPILSELMGHGCRLTYGPSTRTVIWATPQADGRWDVAEVNPYTVIVRMPQAIHVKGASEEYKLLTRALLPVDSADAVQRIQEMTAQLRRRIEVLEDIHRDEWETNRDRVPYTWHPIDEI
ncbi:helix-turn-helix transcriptional regulator (plasmid) [Streptomyces sp. BHT-5-2]|uniref:helix-turn-helix transcriptional regulator n=1 Tax=Streptomyces sp. BHT-5-2 TaxID=2866715 RepID=UPI001C8F111C|nr:helix-turn-helix transcriptional regulator [Streptomyces sp. BHT-5-2]QZL07285.1 helix-turn-helix transcriptional regulator [Streptomyces sp. BHT-5-2]